jgi:hypothetical protein
MNKQTNDGHTIINNSIKRVTIINGVKYPWNNKMRGNTITQVNGKIYIDGYELRNGNWVLSIKAVVNSVL